MLPLVGKAGLEPARWISYFHPRETPPVSTLSPLPQMQTDKNHNRTFTMLYQLSYTTMVGALGLEPKTLGTQSEVSVMCNAVNTYYYAHLWCFFNSQNKQN